MHNDFLEANWKQIRGQAKVWWGKLTDDDLEQISGKYDILVGKLQEKYAYSREEAENEIDRHVREYHTNMKNPDYCPNHVHAPFMVYVKFYIWSRPIGL